LGWRACGTCPTQNRWQTRELDPRILDRDCKQWNSKHLFQATGQVYAAKIRKTGVHSVAYLTQEMLETKMQVSVRDNNVDQALRALKKKLQREGVFREMRLKEHFEKPSVRKAREKAEGISRQRKLARKKTEREGLL
jgi:small subunit ribosomal protein S21